MKILRLVAVTAVALGEFGCLWRCQQYGMSPYISDVAPFGGWPWMAFDNGNWFNWSRNLIASVLVAASTGYCVWRYTNRPSQITIRSVLILMTLAAAACARARLEPDWPDIAWEDSHWKRTFFFPTAPFAPWPLRAAVLIGLVCAICSAGALTRAMYRAARQGFMRR